MDVKIFKKLKPSLWIFIFLRFPSQGSKYVEMDLVQVKKTDRTQWFKSFDVLFFKIPGAVGDKAENENKKRQGKEKRNKQGECRV